MAIQVCGSTEESRRLAADAGFSEWFTGTKWLPIMQVSGAGNDKRCWFNSEKRRIGGMWSDGTCFSFPIR